MSMLSNEKINFKSLEEKTFKEMMKLGRKITKKSYRETAKTISHTAVRNIVLKLGEEIKKLEEKN